jgi:hypothetical protein
VDTGAGALKPTHLPESDALCLWLARSPVQDNHPRPLLFPASLGDNVLIAHENDLLEAVFQRLTQAGISGCPVVDSDGVYVSQVDTLDIVFFLCNLFKARQQATLTYRDMTSQCVYLFW